MTDIIVESDVQEWVKRLPELTINPPTVSLLMLAVRSRKAREITGVKMKDLVYEKDIVRAVSNWRTRYFNRVYNLALLQHQGKFEFRDIKITPEVTGMFGVPTPRDVVKAVGDMMQDNVSKLVERTDSAMSELAKEHSRFFGYLHSHKAKGNHLVTLDLDVNTPEIHKAIRDELTTMPVWMITQTSRGYHYIVQVTPQMGAEFFKSKEGLKDRLLERFKPSLEFKDDSQEPIPGTLYANKENLNNMVKIIQ